MTPLLSTIGSVRATDQKQKVLFIGGLGRSGTTLLERSLGQIEGFCAVGEIRHIWDRSFSANELCGCGVPFRGCDFWTAVVDEAYGGFAGLDASELVAMKYSVDRTRFIPRMIIGGGGTFGRRFTHYQDMLSRLYRAIQKVSGCRVIIDSSKEPSYGFILRSLSSIDLHVLHVIRDSRAVAFSWLKKKQRPDVHWKSEIMPRYAPAQSIGYWIAFNTLLHSFARSGRSYHRLHYEDLVTDPRGRLDDVLSFLGEPQDRFDFLRGDVVDLGTNHTVSGNPMRFERGSVPIRLDTEWRREMAPSDRRLVTLLTFPHLLGYGYLKGRGRRPLPPLTPGFGSSRGRHTMPHA